MLDDRANAERPIGTANFRCSRHVGPPSTMFIPKNIPKWMFCGTSSTLAKSYNNIIVTVMSIVFL